MKVKQTIIISVFLLICTVCFGQEQNIVPKEQKYFISADFGSVISHVETMSPVVSVRYVRKFRKGLGIGLGYQYYDAHFQDGAIQSEWSKIKSSTKLEVKSNAVFIRFDYSLAISSKISVCSYMQYGRDWKRMFAEQTSWNQSEEKDSNPVFMPGFQLSYAFSAISTYILYEYCQPILNSDKMPPYFFNLYNHRIGLGVAYAF
ncbi:MAG: hypothetical protein II926_07245 [Bacteroidales bacterium]|nr:hypothetical protein [Bacteroidales bacterium]